MAHAVTVPADKLNPNWSYTCTDTEIRSGKRILSKESPIYKEFVQPGEKFTKSALENIVGESLRSGWYDTLKASTVLDRKGGAKVVIDLSYREYSSATRCVCKNVGPSLRGGKWIPYSEDVGGRGKCMLPLEFQDELSSWVAMQGKITHEILVELESKIEQWYSDEGYVFARAKDFAIENGVITCSLVEGDITRVQTRFVNSVGDVARGTTKKDFIFRELPPMLSTGVPYNVNAGLQALQRLVNTQLFKRTEVVPVPDELLGEDGIVVEIILMEGSHQSADLDLDWSIKPSLSGEQSLSSLVPGGTLYLEHRNLASSGRSLQASLNTSNFLFPQDDMSFKLEFRYPHVDGLKSKHDRTLQVAAFNSRRVSPIFAEVGLAVQSTFPVYIDRIGTKLSLEERFTPQSLLTLSLVTEEVTTRSETGEVVQQACRELPNGALVYGPPTSFGGKGRDNLLFLQANFTRDNTRSVRGSLVGARDIIQLEQGFGIGSGFPFYNRCQVSSTRFVNLANRWRRPKKPPPVLVLHARWGACLGDLHPYDAHPLGGPYSVRGFEAGELGAARNFLEVAGEVRIPLPSESKHLYVFAEYGTDLGSSRNVLGNSTSFYNKKGSGAALGIGISMGSFRVEWARDCNSGKAAIFAKMGSRF